jgi:hypothetical protein
MEQDTKLIIAAVGLAGLGFFLYKKGLFSKTTTTEVAKDVKVDDVVKKVDDVVKKIDDVVKEVVDTGKKTAVEITKDCVQVGYNCTNKTYNTIQIPIDANCNEYQPEMPQCAEPIRGGGEKLVYDPIGFRDNTYYDQPIRVDYTSGRYYQDVDYDYAQKDLSNVRFNQLLYA